MDSITSIFEGAWGVFLIAVFFGGSIFVHELGHFLAARKRGLKVERFSIGFGPKIFGWTGKDGVDYRVSLLPLGGYVALPQMVDMEAIEGKNESDAESLPPISYADKMIVAVMGAVFNVIFAFFLACVLWAIKMPSTESNITTTIGSVEKSFLGQTKLSPAMEAGLKPGDKILTVDGASVLDFKEIVEKIALGSGRDAEGNPQVTFSVKRGSETLDIVAKPERIELNPESGDAIRRIGIGPSIDIIIAKPAPGSPAEKAGLKQGDEILEVNGTPVYSLNHFKDILDAQEVKEVMIKVKSGGEKPEVRTVALTPVLRTEHVELAKITFKENNNEYSLRLVPVPDDIRTENPKAERRNLMIFDVLPTKSSYSDILKPGTIITSVDQSSGIVAVRKPQDLAQAVTETKGEKITLFYKNGSNERSVALQNLKAEVVKPASTPYIGIRNAIKAELIRKTPVEQFQYAFGITFSTLQKLLDRKSDVQLNHLMGVISMAKIYYSTADDIRRVIWFTIIININLAILNLMPVPVLDGGHMLMATIQKILGRQIPIKIIAGIQYFFVVLLLSLMAYVIFNDVKRCSGDNVLQIQNEIERRYVNKDVVFDSEPK
ncbi:MAG: RIP metalloprotease RseP [Puniceicoccales bacterium]|nr:RIP metalloprotease RseP [Puniceicoccales bacterium]